MGGVYTPILIFERGLNKTEFLNRVWKIVHKMKEFRDFYRQYSGFLSRCYGGCIYTNINF